MVWWKSTDVSKEHIAPFFKIEGQAKEEISRRRRRVNQIKACCSIDERTYAFGLWICYISLQLLITKHY
jgi:hypothetical protein